MADWYILAHTRIPEASEKLPKLGEQIRKLYAGWDQFAAEIEKKRDREGLTSQEAAELDQRWDQEQAKLIAESRRLHQQVGDLLCPLVEESREIVQRLSSRK